MAELPSGTVTFLFTDIAQGDDQHARGDEPQAHVLQRESLAIRRELGDKRGIAECLEGLAAVACARREPSRAARLFAAADALREAIGAPLPPVDHSRRAWQLAAVRAQLDSALFTAAWAEGHAMALERILADVLA